MAAPNPPRVPPPFNDEKKLNDILSAKPTSRALTEVVIALTDEQQQRHRRFLLLLMALVHRFWNGNRRGVMGTYHYRDKQKTGTVWSDGREYLGHNVAAIAVDGNDNVIDFDFNHNDIYRSSLEHAEARLMRRLFSLTGLRAEWSLGDHYGSKEPRPDDPKSASQQRERYATTLTNVTIYTSLEPCAQCAGIMALARVPTVVYLQSDAGARRIANVLYNLAPYSSASLPVPGSWCGMPYGDRLNRSFKQYQDEIQKTETPFHIAPDNKEDFSTSLSTFLCTDFAWDVYRDAACEFKKLVGLKTDTSCDEAKPSEWASQAIGPSHAKKLRSFFEYADAGGHRGTPH